MVIDLVTVFNKGHNMMAKISIHNRTHINIHCISINYGLMEATVKRTHRQKT